MVIWGAEGWVLREKATLPPRLPASHSHLEDKEEFKVPA